MHKLNIYSKRTYLSVILFLLLFISCKKEERLPEVNANFIGNATTILEGDTVTFTDLSTGTPILWEWQFEGGNPSSSNLQNPDITYSEPGTFHVKLTSSNSQNSGIKIKEGYIKVYPRIKSDFTSNKSTILYGDTVEFTDLSLGEPIKWDWEFEGGQPVFSTIQNPNIIYTNPGTYSVKLISSNSQNSDTEVKEGFIKVLSNISASFMTSDSIINQGSTILFTDTSDAEPVEWHWEFEGGSPASSTDRNPSVTFPNAGVFTIKLTASNMVSSDTIIKKIVSMPTDQLAAHYTFNGHSMDATGNGHDGIPHGNINVTSDRFDIEDSAYEFDGIDDFIHTSSIFDYPSRTLSLWINPYDINGFETTAKVAITLDGHQLEYGILRVSFENNTMTLYAAGNSGMYLNSDVKTNSWMHLILIRENDKTKYYIDNVLVHTSTSDNYASSFEPNPYLIIGAGRSGNKQFYKGKIDDIRIYQKALKENEIQALFLGH